MKDLTRLDCTKRLPVWSFKMLCSSVCALH